LAINTWQKTLIALILPGCSFIGPDRGVEVIAKSGAKERVDLTPRHYRALEHCEHALQTIPRNLFNSVQPLSTDQRAKLKWPSRVASYKLKDCESFRTRGEILEHLEDIYASKSQRVGVILPPVSPNEPAIQMILDQMRAELVRAGFNPEKSMIIRRIDKNYDDALRTSAELIHLDRVAMLIGGLHQSHAAAIALMSDLSQTPALIVNSDAALGKTTQTMRVYPPLKRLASRLTETLKAQTVRNAVVFYPSNANLELYHLMKRIPGSRISYSEATYNPDDPQSILSAVKGQTFRLAGIEGLPAVLIFDNFRMVRHIVNIVSTSIPGKQILFAGNQQWRSPALVVPRDEALQGALFVDFIGSYRNLPNSIETPVSDNDYFTTAQAASRIDYQIIGHRLGTLATEAARFGLSRHEIAGRLQSLNNKWDTYFPPREPAFDAQRESSWPVFLFKVVDDTIKEI
jgi:hypothetical protein